MELIAAETDRGPTDESEGCAVREERGETRFNVALHLEESGDRDGSGWLDARDVKSERFGVVHRGLGDGSPLSVGVRFFGDGTPYAAS